MTVEAAVYNNARWCDAVCLALGGDTVWGEGMWTNRRPAPPYYSSALALRRDATDAQLAMVRQMLAGPLPHPWTIKDGFHTLELGPEGFDVLFEATWLGLAADATPLQATAVRVPLRWAPVTDDPGLLAWERTWQGPNPDAAASGMPRLFQPVLLDDPEIRFLAGWLDDRIVSVVAANRSDDGSGPVVGISNIVLGGVDPEAHRADAVAAVRDAFPGLPLVGYEHGPDLEAMVALGFRELAPLRVWIIRA